MGLELSEPRVLISGSRRWPWPHTVESVLNRLAARHGTRLVVIEGAATGADAAAHKWCLDRGLGPDHHRCHPVDWAEEQRTRPKDWRLAGHERNTRMLLQERPELVIAFHHRLEVGAGGTSDMCARALIRSVPVWLITGEDPNIGRWLQPVIFPPARLARIRSELEPQGLQPLWADEED